MSKAYQETIHTNQIVLNATISKSNGVVVGRIIAAGSCLFLLYQAYQTGHSLFYLGAFICLSLFFLIANIHQKVEKLKRLLEEKIAILNLEIKLLSKQPNPYDSGEEFINTTHAYTHDLDVFGENSLFHYLNRSGTTMGKKVLAKYLTSTFQKSEILANQQAVEELAPLLSFRTELLAIAQLEPDNSSSEEYLTSWVKKAQPSIAPIFRIFAIISAAALCYSFGAYFLLGNKLMGSIGSLLFIINLGLLAIHFPKIKTILSPALKIEKIVKHYGWMLKLIESQDFQSEKLQALQKIVLKDNSASKSIDKLSKLFGQMEQIENVFVSGLLNGCFLFHIHKLHQLHAWHQSHANELMKWLDVIGEMECLSTLSNYRFNNQDTCYPTISSTSETYFKSIGHPLLAKDNRITNDISFIEHRFVILTGSNMSGKSTFLRTIGINLILGGVGAPICASEAQINPMPILVSMRQTDSLTEGESYFYAEVKRLNEIINALRTDKCFVLLDELLKGTNSDDKRNGTQEIIKKMISLNATGIIATHDLEICELTNQYPENLTNKCFEAEIVHDELLFDYQLKEGVCRNKSATFLMKKMNII